MFKQLKYILITIGVCLVISISFYIIQEVRHKRELRQRVEIAYMKGKSEEMLANNEFLIDALEKSLEKFKQRIEDYNKTIDRIEKVTHNVSKKMENLNNAITNLDNAFTELYGAWAVTE